MKYNPLKLSVHRQLFHDLPVLVIGTGAVGTYLMEFLAKMGCSPDCIDPDHFTEENAAKHSALIRPEDVGRNKAVCTAERVQPYLDEGCSAHGVEGDLCDLGPEVLANYRYVLSAVDNPHARVLLSQLVRQLTPNRRPKVIMCGTNDEMATSVLLDHEDFCLRCLIDEDILLRDSVRRSCTLPELRTFDDGSKEIVRTTHMASSMAAHLACEQLRADVVGIGDMNRQLTYTAYPVLELSTSTPSAKPDCPGCAVRPGDVRYLEGNMQETTLGHVLWQIENSLGTENFEISTHRLFYQKVHSEFIADMVCGCGAVTPVLKHESRILAGDLFCAACGAIPTAKGQRYHAFDPLSTPPHIRALSMFELGYPLGGHIEVICRGEGLDALDGGWTKTVFAFREDAGLFRETDHL